MKQKLIVYIVQLLINLLIKNQIQIHKILTF